MKKYPIGIQDFQKLREGGFLYVDKTEAVFNLIKQGQYYFLSRPRRFGKSLLLSTLKYLFLGERELFEGLWIDGEYDFQPHPVLHFSFSTLGYKEIGSDVFESYTLENLNWKSLLFQTGYLTIQIYHKEDRLYTLGYPNLEVKDAMHRHLLGAFRESDKSESQP